MRYLNPKRIAAITAILLFVLVFAVLTKSIVTSLANSSTPSDPPPHTTHSPAAITMTSEPPASPIYSPSPTAEPTASTTVQPVSFPVTVAHTSTSMATYITTPVVNRAWGLTFTYNCNGKLRSGHTVSIMSLNEMGSGYHGGFVNISDDELSGSGERFLTSEYDSTSGAVLSVVGNCSFTIGLAPNSVPQGTAATGTIERPLPTNALLQKSNGSGPAMLGWDYIRTNAVVLSWQYDCDGPGVFKIPSPNSSFDWIVNDSGKSSGNGSHLTTGSYSGVDIQTTCNWSAEVRTAP